MSAICSLKQNKTKTYKPNTVSKLHYAKYPCDFYHMLSDFLTVLISQNKLVRNYLETKLYSDEKRQGSFNLCQRDLPADSDAYGDWIYLNGSQNALVEYQVGTACYTS